MSDALPQSTQKSAYERLPRRHRRFVDHFVIGSTATEALRSAGCKSPHLRSVASKLLRKPDVVAAIDERTELHLQDVTARKHKTLEQVIAIAYADPRKVVDAETGQAVPLEKMDPGTAAAISSVEVENISINGETGTRYKYRFWDKNKALEKLGQWQKLWDGPGARVNVDARTVNLTANVGGPEALRAVADLGQRLAALTAGPRASDADPDRSVLPASICDGTAGRGTPVDAGAHSGSAGKP